MKRQIRYAPFPTTSRFHASGKFVRGLMGPYGSGKSVACCIEIFSRAKEQQVGPSGKRKSRWAITRNSYGELRSTTQNTWLDWFPADQFGPIKRGSGPDVHTVNIDDVELEVLFIALDREDDARKLLSLELTGLWLNEAREIPWNIVEAGLARVGRYPSKGNDVGATWSGMIMDTNPPNTRHWWYQRFEVDQPKGWELFKQPGGRSGKGENLENLPEDYYNKMASGMDELSIRCHVDGEYAYLRSGQPVFSQFKHSLHVAKQPLNVIPREEIYCGIDVGRSPGAVFCQERYGGRVHVLSEITGSDIPAVTLCELIKRHVSQYYPMTPIDYIADPKFTDQSQTRDESVADIFYNAGLNVYGAHTNSIEVRLETVRGLLQKLDPTGEPMLLVDPGCEVLIEAMVGGYSYKEQAVGGGRFRDLPEKNQYSHIADALQYAMLGMGLDPRIMGTTPRIPKVHGISKQPWRTGAR